MTAEIIESAVFRVQCSAAVNRYASGYRRFHDAVDDMQVRADVSGIVRKIGQDAVQAIMVDAIRPVREAEWKPAGGRPKFNYGPSILELEAEALRRRGVPKSVLDAADYVQREYGPDDLRQWLDAHRQYLPAILDHWERGNG